MSKRVVITNKGLELLASSSEATGNYWWIGYYNMAYVPNFWKESSVSLPSDPETCDNVHGTASVPAGKQIETTDTDRVHSGMTRLTKYGDMIYNIFQGDLVGTGYFNCVSDGTPGGDLFGLTMYNTNIKKHYRYVLNEYGNNVLVTWIDDPDTDDGQMLGKHAYLGTDGFIQSDMPIPAPLYYLGNGGLGTAGNDSVDNFFPAFEDDVVNGSSVYPFLEDLTLKPDGSSTLNVPKVSVDYREYLDTQGYNETHVYTDNIVNNPTNDGAGDPRTAGGEYFDSLEIASDVDSNFDSTSWFAANLTMLPNYGESDDAIHSKEFWKLHSISNYNKFHAPVTSTGHIYSSDLGNRNMATVTKLFPISNYKVINTQQGTNSSGEDVEFATGLTLTVDLDIAPRTKKQGFDSDGNFNETTDLTSFDKYDLSDKATVQTEQPYYEGSSDNIEDQFSKNIFDTSHTSFKFNRIGIYAVPMRKCPFVKNEADPTGKDVTLQFEINPDVEPVLYAVVDWDNTVTLDDTGDGIHQFRADININLKSPAGNLDADALVRDSTIFYNLYEDDAITWYKNQLIANASTQHAITELQQQLGHITSELNTLKCCLPPDLSQKFASKNHNHPFEGARHIKDGDAIGSLRGISTPKESNNIDIVSDAFLTTEETVTEKYYIDDNSVVLGAQNNWNHASKNSFVDGKKNTLYHSDTCAILNGEGNIVGDDAIRSFVGAGHNNRLAHTRSSMIGAGIGNSIILSDSAAPTRASAIISGKNNVIETGNSSVIGAGYNNLIRNKVSAISSGDDGFGNNFIAAGLNNQIINGNKNLIGTGHNNRISASTQVDNSAIVSGLHNLMTTANNCFIGSGDGNEIHDTNSSVIVGGFSNRITQDSRSGILSGELNVIEFGNSHNTISGGLKNRIFKSKYSTILGGSDNEVNETSYATVSGKGAKASAYGESVKSSGEFVEAGDAQKSNLLYRIRSTGIQNEYSTDTAKPLMDNYNKQLALDNIAEYFNFSKNYQNKHVGFSGDYTIMANAPERTYWIKHITLINGDNEIIIELANGFDDKAYISPENGGSDDYENPADHYFDDGDIAEIEITGVANSLISGTYNSVYKRISPNAFSVITQKNDTGSDIQIDGTGKVNIKQPSVYQKTAKFIGWYDGFNNKSYITTETGNAYIGANNVQVLRTGLFDSVEALMDIDTELITDEKNLLYITAIGPKYSRANWMGDVNLLITSINTIL